MVRWHCPPDTGFEIRARVVWGRTRYLSITEAPHNTEFHTWMGKKHFCFFQTAETGNRTPNFSMKGSGANHYPRNRLHFVIDRDQILSGLGTFYWLRSLFQWPRSLFHWLESLLKGRNPFSMSEITFLWIRLFFSLSMNTFLLADITGCDRLHIFPGWNHYIYY